MDYKGFYDYRVEVYKDERLLGTFGYVSNVWLLTFWLNFHFIYWRWTSIKVYHRVTNTFLGQYARGEQIPAKPEL